MSRAVATALATTPVTPNMVSVLGALMAAAAAMAFVSAPWPVAAFVGFGFQVAWHVFDGADGDLARRTGRASTNGELVDGICDHLGQLCIYVAFALLTVPLLGPWAWAAAVAAGLSRAAQASAYEALRKNYRRWIYGAGWMRQSLTSDASQVGGLKSFLGKTYLALADRVSADDHAVEGAMSRLTREPGPKKDAAEEAYRRCMRPLVKKASILSANNRTLVAFASVLAGWPIAYLVFEAVVLNVVLMALIHAEKRANSRLADALGELDASR